MSRFRTACVAALCLISALAAAGTPFEKILPEDTLAVIAVRDVPGLQAKIKKQPIYALWNEPSVQRFLEKPLKRLNQEIQKAEGQAGVTMDEVLSLLQGQAAIVLSTGAQAEEPEAILLAEVGNQGARAMQLINTLCVAIAKAKAMELRQVEEQIEGTAFIRIQQAAGQGAAPEPLFTYGVAGEVFILGRPLAAVKRTAGFLRTPPAKGLASSASFQGVLNKVSPESDVVAYVNLARILGIIAQKSQKPEVLQIINALGLNGMTAFGVGVTLGSDYNISRIYMQTTGTPQGILKILMPAPGPLHTGAEAPADAASFLSVRFNPAAAWDEVETILADVAPQALTAFNAVMNQVARDLGQPFSLRNDILAVFGPRAAIYTRFEKPYNLMTSQQIVFLVDISSKAAFDAALEKLQKAAPRLFAIFQPKDYLGHRLYVLMPPTPPGANPNAGIPEGMPRPAFVATEREFIFSINVTAVEAHLRRAGGASLQDRPEFQEGLRGLPSEGRVLIGFNDPARHIEFLLTALREGQFAPVTHAVRRDADIAEVLDLFDLSILPDPADLTKHIATAASVVTVQPDGLLMTTRASARPVR